MANLPQSITINLGKSYNINTIRYLPRQDASGNGVITNYNIYTSLEGVNFTKVVNNGTWANDITKKTVTFAATPASYIKLEAISGYAGFASAAEINIEY